MPNKQTLSIHQRTQADTQPESACHIQTAYLRGVIIGNEFISEGKDFFISTTGAHDDKHVWSDLLFVEGDKR